MTPTISFPKGPAQKAELLAVYDRHIAADTLVAGHGYWRGGKGCAVGCALHDLMPEASPDDHAVLGAIIGGEAIARLLDFYFERVRPHQQTARRIVEAIPVGRDLSMIGWQHGAWCLRQAEAKHGIPAIGEVAALFERAARGDMPTQQEWHAAARAAYSASAAAYSSYSAAAAYSAYSAAYSASAAAYSASAAAYSAASSEGLASEGLEHFIQLLQSA